MAWDEDKFQEWWETNDSVLEWRKSYVDKYGVEPDQDTPDYNYRKAFESGEVPKTVKGDSVPHWSSEFKGPNHPNRYVVQNGKTYDTITGREVPTGLGLMQQQMRPANAPLSERERENQESARLRGVGRTPTLIVAPATSYPRREQYGNLLFPSRVPLNKALTPRKK